MIFVGIDYSLTSPCVCVSKNKVFADSYFHFLTDNKRLVGKVGNIFGDEHDEYLCDQQRYENIAAWVLNIINPIREQDHYILIEDYSFGSKGRVFNLAENCGLLKYMLYKEQFKFFTVPPTVFNPPPKVDSGVMRMIRKENYKLECDEKLLFTVVKTAFQQRRKTGGRFSRAIYRDEGLCGGSKRQ